MLSNIEMVLADVPWIAVLVWLIDIALKGLVICAVAAIATLLLRRSSAFVRSTVWISALAGLLLLPVFSLTSPILHLPIIPDITKLGVGTYSSEKGKPEQDASVTPQGAARVDVSRTNGESASRAPAGLPWYAWAILAWIAGGIAYLGGYLISQAGVRSIVRSGHAADERWTQLLGGVANELDVRRHVRLLESDRINAAITVGILDPVIVLPSDCDKWPASRRRLVLSHELAHVKRWDTLTETFALFAMVLHWFNPLVWFAVRRMRIERETDCDNAVLRTGAKPSDYAELLMNLAADLNTSTTPAWQLSTISQSSNVKDRLMDILNQKVNRTRGSRRSAFVTGAIALLLMLPISMSGIWSNASSQTADKSQDKTQQEKTKEQKKAEWEAKTPQEKSAAMWERVCYEENSAACIVGKKMQTMGTDAGLAAFYKMKEAEEGKYVFNEKEFNSLGYAFLFVEQTDQAIAVLKLNVAEYPESWNCYDSLGEAYTAAKNYNAAIENYEIAVKMNPEGEYSKAQLEKLRTMVAESSVQ